MQTPLPYFGRLVDLSKLTEADKEAIQQLKLQGSFSKYIDFPAAGISVHKDSTNRWDLVCIHYLPAYVHYESFEQQKMREFAESVAEKFNLPLYDVWAVMEATRSTCPDANHYEPTDEEVMEVAALFYALFPSIEKHWRNNSPGISFVTADKTPEEGGDFDVFDREQKVIVHRSLPRPMRSLRDGSVMGYTRGDSDMAVKAEAEPKVLATYKSTDRGRELLWEFSKRDFRTPEPSPLDAAHKIKVIKVDENDIDACLRIMRQVQKESDIEWWERELHQYAGKRILTAVIVDESLNKTPREEEIVQHTITFETLLERSLEVYIPSIFYESEIRQGTELILFDYGGMSVGNDLLESQSRRLVQYAADHPSCLIVVVSTFCWHKAVRSEMEEFCGKEGLPNLVVWEGGDCVPKWFKESIKEPK